jgi:hypothetical protein
MKVRHTNSTTTHYLPRLRLILGTVWNLDQWKVSSADTYLDYDLTPELTSFLQSHNEECICSILFIVIKLRRTRGEVSGGWANGAGGSSGRDKAAVKLIF